MNNKRECKGKNIEYNENSLNYRLVWSDEFDYEGMPDESKWDYDVGVRFNNELQQYTAEGNVGVRDGRLIITAKKEKMEWAEYTSCRLVTRNKGDWLYGKFEVSARLPSGRGTWPAIWMLPTDSEYGHWPASGEIDIMEHVGYDPDYIHQSIHTLENNTITDLTMKIPTKNVCDSFHKYSVIWLPDKIKFLIDDEVHLVYRATDLEECPDYNHWPFDKRFHLLLNVAIGGFFGGVKGVDDSIFPQSMEVEYVRVYQADEFRNIV